MQTVEDIRRANLILLIEEAGSAARLSAITGVPAPYISQVKRGVQHSTGAGPRLMGPEVARKLEAKMGKPRGWMDADHSALQIASDLNGREGQLVGLFRLLNDADQAALVHELTMRLRRSGPAPKPPDLGDSLRH